MANWLKKLIVVEENNQGVDPAELENILASSQNNSFASANVEVNVSQESLAGLIQIDEIYVQSGLEDKSKSIFKVDEFSKVLPDTLATDAKRQSVIGILAASGLQVDGLRDDAAQRIGAIDSVMSQFEDQTNAIVNAGVEEITRLTAEIDRIKTEINDRKTLQEKQEKIAQEEVSKIEEIVKFLG